MSVNQLHAPHCWTSLLDREILIGSTLQRKHYRQHLYVVSAGYHGRLSLPLAIDLVLLLLLPPRLSSYHVRFLSIIMTPVDQTRIGDFTRTHAELYQCNLEQAPGQDHHACPMLYGFLSLPLASTSETTLSPAHLRSTLPLGESCQSLAPANNWCLSTESSSGGSAPSLPNSQARLLVQTGGTIRKVVPRSLVSRTTILPCGRVGDSFAKKRKCERNTLMDDIDHIGMQRSQDTEMMSEESSMKNVQPGQRSGAMESAVSEPHAGPSRRPALALRREIVSTSPYALPQDNTTQPKVRRRPAKLKLTSPSVPPTTRRTYTDGSGSRSVPASPTVDTEKFSTGHRSSQIEREDLREALRGTPRRRSSVLFNTRSGVIPPLSIQTQTVRQPPATQHTFADGPPRIWQDPSEHTLSGDGSSLQHARSSYAAGAIEVLPGLFLGDEFNARDERWLTAAGITTILNVSKETVLPFHEDDEERDVSLLPRSFSSQTGTSLSSGLERSLNLWDETNTPTSLSHGGVSRPPLLTPFHPTRASTEDLRTPLSAASPLQPPSSHLPQHRRPLQSSPQQARPSLLYLRNHSSTPNLLASASRRPSLPVPSENDIRHSQEMMGEAQAGTLDTDMPVLMADEKPSHVQDQGGHGASLAAALSPASPSEAQRLSPSDTTLLTPASSFSSKQSPNTSATSRSSSSSSSSSSGSWTITLPENAVALHVPPSPGSERTWALRYIKLPWTHDETDLASVTSNGGFITGCSIIADALGIHRGTGQRLASAGQGGNWRGNTRSPGNGGNGSGGILVHCQCGVSRSATLVIAFVMQAAALRYGFAQTQALTGMHDCYEMVKELSASISPNISLIYQLVEWERYLSGRVSLEESAAGAASSAASTYIRAASTSTPMSGSSEGLNTLDSAGRQPGTAASPPSAPGERRWGKETMDEVTWMRMRAEEERREQEEDEASRQAASLQGEGSSPSSLDSRGRNNSAGSAGAAMNTNGAAQLLSHPPPAGGGSGVQLSAAGSGVGARRRKASPMLTLMTSAMTGADRALRNAAAPLPAASAASGSSLSTGSTTLQRNSGSAFAQQSLFNASDRVRAPMTTLETMTENVAEEEATPVENEDDDNGRCPEVSIASAAAELPFSPAEGSSLTSKAARSQTLPAQQTHLPISKSLSRIKTSEAGTAIPATPKTFDSSARFVRTSPAAGLGGQGFGSGGFGALRQSAAERRMKHKRTFSAEVPDWPMLSMRPMVSPPSSPGAASPSPRGGGNRAYVFPPPPQGHTAQ